MLHDILIDWKYTTSHSKAVGRYCAPSTYLAPAKQLGLAAQPSFHSHLLAHIILEP